MAEIIEVAVFAVGGGRSSSAITFTSAPNEDDLIVLLLGRNNGYLANTAPAPTGFTEVGSDERRGEIPSAISQAFGRIGGSAEPATYTITHGTQATQLTGYIVRGHNLSVIGDLEVVALNSGGTASSPGTVSSLSFPSSAQNIEAGSVALFHGSVRGVAPVISGGSLTADFGPTFSFNVSSVAASREFASAQSAFQFDLTASPAEAMMGTLIIVEPAASGLTVEASGSLSMAGVLSRQVNKNTTGSITQSGLLARATTRLRSLAGSMTASGALARTTARLLSLSYAAAGAVSRALGVAKALSYAATATATAAKAVSTSKVFGATGTAVASAQKVFLNAFAVAATGTLTFAQELTSGAQEYLRSFTSIASAAASLATTVIYRHSASATALATPSVVRHLSKLLQASAIGGTALERLLNGGAIENIRIFSPPITIYALADITGKVKWVDYIPVRVENTEKRGHYDDDGCFHVVALPSVGGLREWVDYMPVYAVGSGKRWKYDDDGYIPVNEV